MFLLVGRTAVRGRKDSRVCIRCREIERDLRHFHELLAEADTNDRVALFLLTESIKDLQSEKLALHPAEPTLPGDTQRNLDCQ